MESYNIYRDQIVVYEFQLDLNFSDSLQSDNYITTTIESKNELDLRINDYILVDGVKYSIYKPIEMEESNGVYSYPVTFYAPYYRANFSILEDEGATTFPYHGRVSDFMLLIIQSLQKDYPDFTLGEIDEGGIIDLTFDNSNCLAAIQTICEAADMEFRFDGSVLNVKKRIGNETDYIFEYGKNKGGYSVKLSQVANASITTRMIGKGGSINLPKDYVSPDSPKRLNLGNEILEKNVDKYGKITGVYINENIYPRLINKTVQAVEVPVDPQTAASWKIKLDIPFNLADYYADNEIPLVKFQTGDLTGSEFEIVENSWNNTDKTLSIIVQDQDGYVLPNKDRQPRVGDVFVLLNIYMPKSYVDEATEELKKATQDELNRKSVPQYAPTLIADGRYIKKNNINLSIGDGITVKIGSNSLATRIIGITKSSSSNEINYDLGDQILYSYDTKTNNTLERIQTTLKQLINIDDIKRLFYNLINGWYPKWFDQKLHKDADVKFNSVEAKESVKTESVTANVISSEQFVSGPLGQGYRINKNGDAEVQNLTVRGTFSVFELLIQQIRAVGGQLLVAPASIKISLVEETNTGYKCSFNTENGTIPNPFVVNDQLIHQVFTGNSINRYWRLVTEIGVNYFVLSKDDCEAGSGTPAPDDEIMLLGNRTAKDRQSAILISAYGSDTPFVAYYAGINSFSLSGKEIMREGNLNGIVDKDFGQLQGFGVYMQNAYIKGILRLTSGKTVEEAVGDVQSNLDNLQIGGVNILEGSTTGILWDFSTHNGTEFSRTGTSTAENSYIYSDYIILKGDTEIVLSFYAKHVGVLNSFDLYILPDDFNTYGLIEKGYQSGEDWVYNVLKLKTPSKWGDGKRVRLRIDHNGSPDGSSATIYVKDVQIEYGNKATTYSVPESDREVIAKQHAIDVAAAEAALAETRANAYADGIVTEAEQNAINEAQARLDALQIGSQNLISKKMMLKWNEKNKDIAVWGQDADGIYLAVNQKLLYNSIAEGTERKDIFNNAIQFKQNTQNVLSFEYKSSKKIILPIISFRIYYTDGSFANVNLSGSNTTKTRSDYITDSGKTVDRISLNDSISNENALIYNISLIEGNKPLQGFPVAEEDQTGANNVNLADGTKEFTVTGGTGNWVRKELYVSKIKPNTVYYVNAGNIQNLAGTPSKYTFVLYDKDITAALCPMLNADKNGGFLITYNNFTEQEGLLLCYAGVSGSTAGNSVKFTEVMLVEGFLPAPVWTPSFSEQQAEIKTITKTLTEIKAENGEISLRVNEVSERVEEAKQEAIDEAKEYTTIQTYRETDIDLRAEKWDQDTYYPVTIKLSNPETRIEVVSPLDNYFGIPKWSAHELGFSMHCVWRSNGSNLNSNIVKRTIEVFEYKYTEQNIHPAGSIGQLTSSSEELIYLRGGGRYLFKIGNNCVAVVHDSRYTAPDGSSVAPAASVIRPVLTNATKEELNAEINITKGLIENKVSLDVYNENDQLIKSDISNLQVSYNQISSTVSKIINGTQEISGVVTQSNFVTIFSSNKNALGQEVIESINVGGGGVTIDASRINLNGAISANGNVQITTDGKLIAVNGEFTGKITATSGIIGGFEIGSTYIQNGGLKLSSGSIEYKKDKLQSNFGALYTGITGIATGLYIKNTAISTTNRHELCAYFQGSIGDLQINSSKAMIETYNVSSMHYALYIPSGQVYMNANSGGIFFKNVQNVNGKSNYYLCIDRSTGQLYYR